MKHFLLGLKLTLRLAMVNGFQKNKVMTGGAVLFILPPKILIPLKKNMSIV